MKILILTNHSYMLFQFRRELIEKLLENNKIVIGTPFGDHIADFRAMGCRMLDIPIDRRGINPKTDLELYKQYKRVIKEEKPDKVITYSIKPNIYAGFACRIEKIPYYVNVQGLGTAFQKKGLATVVTMMYKVALKKAQRVFFENEANAQEFINRRILKEDKIVVLHGAGVNLEKFVYQPYPREDDGIHFLYLGRIMKEKGMDELFQAAKNLKAKYGDKIVFDIVGFFEDEYKATVEQLEKDGIIVFHGFQADPRPFYAMAHCVVLPSYHEGMSNVLLEAAATGRAVITSDIPGCREAIEDDKNGFLVEVKSSDKLEKAMEKFLSCSMDERRNMGLYGRAYMERVYDKKLVVEATLYALK